MPVRGDLDCQGAVFIYKNDNSQSLAWEDARNLGDHLRVELHKTKPAFLAGLTNWNRSIDPENGFLAIYAHMGDPGMAPTTNGAANEIVTWADLSGALARRVHTVWLIGCHSQSATLLWQTPKVSPVLGTLLVTSESEHWLPLLEQFQKEVGRRWLGAIPFDEMEMAVRAAIPAHAEHIHYYDADNQSAWKKLSPTPPFSPDVLTDVTDPVKLGRALWGDWSAPARGKIHRRLYSLRRHLRLKHLAQLFQQ